MGTKDTNLLLVQVHSRGEGTLSQIAKHVQGEMVNLSRLQQLTDVTKIKKVSLGVNCHRGAAFSPAANGPPAIRPPPAAIRPPLA